MPNTMFNRIKEALVALVKTGSKYRRLAYNLCTSMETPQVTLRHTLLLNKKQLEILEDCRKPVEAHDEVLYSSLDDSLGLLREAGREALGDSYKLIKIKTVDEMYRFYHKDTNSITGETDLVTEVQLDYIYYIIY